MLTWLRRVCTGCCKKSRPAYKERYRPAETGNPMQHAATPVKPTARTAVSMVGTLDFSDLPERTAAPFCDAAGASTPPGQTDRSCESTPGRF